MTNDQLQKRIKDLELEVSLLKSNKLEQIYRGLVENSSVGVFKANLQGEITYANPAIVKTLGFESLDDLISAKQYVRYKNPEQREYLLDRLIKHGYVKDYEATFFSKNGNEIIGQINLLLKDEMVDGVFIDITEQKIARAEQIAGTERYSALINNLEAGVVVHAADSSIVSANDKAAELLGLSQEQMQGKLAIDPAWNFFREDHTPLPVQNYPVNRIIREKQAIKNLTVGVFRPLTNDLVWLSVNGFPVLNAEGETLEIVNSFIDITERKQAEEALRNEKIRMNEIMDMVGDPIFIKDNEHRITMANRAFCEMFCMEEKSVLGKTLAEAVPETERQNFLAVDRQVLDTGTPNVQEEKMTVNGYTRTIITRKIRFTDESANNFLLGSIHDITERKRFELALYESEQKYREMVENSPIAVFKSKLSGEIIYANQSTVELLEFNSMQELLSTKSTVRYKYANQRKEVIALLNEKGSVRNYEAVFLTNSGKEKYGSLNLTLNGEILDGSLIDNTDRKKVEQALIESEQNYRDLVENAAVGVFKTKVTGEILYVNPALLNMGNFESAAELLGKKSVLSYKFSNQRDEVLQQIQKFGHVENYEIVLLTKTGESRFGSVNMRISGDTMDGTIIDITERKLAEEALHESEQKYRDLVENASVGVFKTKVTGELIYMNPAIIKMGYFETVEQIHAIKASIRYKFPKQREAIIRQIKETGFVENFEAILFDKNGEEKIGSINMILRGDIMDGTIIDITERKRAEAALLQAKELAEKTVSEKEHLLHEKEIMLKEIHHRVKNNLQTISSMLTLQSSVLKDSDAKKAIAESQSRVHTMAAVHQKLYQTDGVERLEFNSFIADLTRQIQSVYINLANSVSISLQIPETHLIIDDAIPLGLIFNELLTNSFKYAFNDAKKGDIKITLNHEKDSSNGSETKNVSIMYWDSGPGYESENQLNKSATIGLRLIKLLSRQIDATIHYTNDNGSKYLLTFPLRS